MRREIQRGRREALAPLGLGPSLTHSLKLSFAPPNDKTHFAPFQKLLNQHASARICFIR